MKWGSTGDVVPPLHISCSHSALPMRAVALICGDVAILKLRIAFMCHLDWRFSEEGVTYKRRNLISIGFARIQLSSSY
jgi:hypothetical protein